MRFAYGTLPEFAHDAASRPDTSKARRIGPTSAKAVSNIEPDYPENHHRHRSKRDWRGNPATGHREHVNCRHFYKAIGKLKHQSGLWNFFDLQGALVLEFPRRIGGYIETLTLEAHGQRVFIAVQARYPSSPAPSLRTAQNP